MHGGHQNLYNDENNLSPARNRTPAALLVARRCTNWASYINI
jgi:hypothetical protein